MKHLINIKTIRVLSLLLLSILFWQGSSVPVLAASLDQEQHVYDEAGLLSSSEIEELEGLCIKYGEKAGIEIIILTHDDSSAPYAETYIENFEDKLPVGDRVYLLVDMYNRDVFMEGYGKAETYIHSKRIDVILDEIVPELSDGNFYNAFVTYIEKSAAYMEDDSELNYDHDYTVGRPQSKDPNAAYYDETWSEEYNTAENPLSSVWLQLIISFIIGAVVVGIMAYNSGGRMTTGADSYIDSTKSGLIGRQDMYLRTHVTKVRKPQNNNTSGGSGGFNAGGFRGGTSSGGRSHSSGGRKF